MNKYVQLGEFTRSLFDSPSQAHQVALILKAILEAQSPRISAISHTMPGKPEAKDKAAQRLLACLEPQEARMRLFQVDAPFAQVMAR